MNDVVAMVTPFARGGHVSYTREVLNALAKQDPSRKYIWLASVDSEIPHADSRFEVERIFSALKDASTFPSKVHWILARVGYYARRGVSLTRYLVKNPEIRAVHFQEIDIVFGSFVNIIIKILLKRNVVITAHNIIQHRKSNRMIRKIVHILTRAVFRTADHLVVHSESLKVQLSERYKISPELIIVAPHGVWSRQQDRPNSKDTSKGEFNILFFGVIRENKNLHLLIDAMSFLPENFRLRIAGRIEEQSYFDTQIRPRIEGFEWAAERIDCNFDFVPDSQLTSVFGDCGCIVLPYTDFAAQSGVLFDAVAFGVPVICSNWGALGETVMDFELGTTLDEVNPATIAEAIRELHSRVSNGLFTTHFARARTHFSWDKHAMAVMSVY